MPDRPPHCPNGHPLGPGRYSLTFALCETCDTDGCGHDRLYCNTCNARLWLDHPGAVWERWSGTGWTPV
jgi:hypothetical protein